MISLKKRGRPLKDGARRKRIYMYLSEEEYSFLRNASDISGKSLSEIARVGTIRYSADTLKAIKK